MKEMSELKRYPTSLRLVDNNQYAAGVALKPIEPNWLKAWLDKMKK